MELLRQICSGWGIEVSPETLERFERYRATLSEWNVRFNLTALEGPDEVARKHFADSLAVLLAVDPNDDLDANPLRLVDIGSGAGLPGVALKLLRPAWRVTLVEANRKKAGFLEHLVADLGLAGVEVVAERAEALGRDPAHRERYGLATARAVTELAVLCEYALPLLAVGGRFVAPKGPRPEAELDLAGRALGVLGGRAAETIRYDLGGGEGTRSLVVIDKVAPSPARYPRRPGIPAKRPLGGR